MKKRAFLLVIAACLLWGLSGVFVHYLAPLGFSTAEMTFARGLVSVLFLLGLVLIRDRSALKARPVDLLRYALIGFTLFGTGYFYFAAMQLSSVSTAVVLMYTAPVFVMVVSVLFLGEKLTRKKLIAVVAMLVGCCLVAGVIGGFRFHPLGIVFGILSGVSYAAYNILTKISLQRGGKPTSATFYGVLIMTVVAVLFCDVPSLAARVVQNPLPALPLLIGIGIVTLVLPYLLYATAMNTLEAGTASALGIVEPMAATVYSFAFLGESLDVFSIVGIVLILFAVLFLGYSEKN